MYSQFDIAVTKTSQEIIQPEIQNASQIEEILAGVSIEVRNEVIKMFHENEKLRVLFPEKAYIFDQHDFAISNAN